MIVPDTIHDPDEMGEELKPFVPLMVIIANSAPDSAV